MKATSVEIRNQWKDLRSALGNLICAIDGKTKQLVDMEQSYQKGYDRGYEDGTKQNPRITNANKFVEVFGFMPGYEELDGGGSYYPSLDDNFWSAEYEAPNDDVPW